MPVSFGSIPPNLRVPLFWAEFDASQAGYLQTVQQACLLGYKNTDAPAEPERPYLIAGPDQAIALFGRGSMLADMVQTYRNADGVGVLYCIAVPGPTGGASGTATVTFTGTPTASGIVAVYVGDRRYPLAVSPQSTPTTLAAALAAGMAADPWAPAAAVAAAGVVTLTANHAGSYAAGLQVGINLRGIVAGEWTPAGLTAEATAFTGGAGDPDVTKSLAALADTEYDYVGVPWNDPATLDAIQLAFGEASGRWAWNIMLYGHAFSARPGTAQELVTFGQTRNDPHVSILGYPATAASPPWRYTAAFTAQAAIGLRADPARPLQTLPLVGLMFAPPGLRFTVSERQAMLFAGIATCTAAVDGVPHIERAATTYQRNQYGQADPSWLDVQTPATLQFIVRTLRNAITTKFPRHKLANDGTRFGPGQAVATPGIIRDELIAQYRLLESQGLCENMPAFKKFLIVERALDDPNRVNVLLPPDLVNQLRILAMLVQFRLQFAETLLTAAAA